MAARRTTSRPRPVHKNVACLESHWDEVVEDPLTLRHVLETASAVNGFRFIYLTCNTEAELDYNLGLLKSRRSYRIVYLAFHGKPGRLHLPTARLDLEAVAQKLGRRFAGRILHLGTCGTIAVPKARLREFMRATGIALLLGYDHPVDWLEAASTELLLLDRLQRYTQLRAFWRDFLRYYGSLVRVTGLRAIHPS
jgi:hypothetical protein